MNPTDIVSLAQVLATLISAIGIIFSISISIKTLKETQIDRELRFIPYLAFKIGGYRYPIIFNKKITNTKNSSRDIVFIQTKSLKSENGEEQLMFYGDLINYGIGPAIETFVTWEPAQITFGSDTFFLDNKKREEKRYRETFNTIPATPKIISPNESANFFILPRFVSMESERKIDQSQGRIIIKCKDLFNNTYITIQEFFLELNYQEENPYIHITFKDVVDRQFIKRKSEGKGLNFFLKNRNKTIVS